MGKKLKILSVVLLVYYLGATGTALGDTTYYDTLPANVVNTNASIGSVTLDGPGPGTVAGNLNGNSVDWYTGYSFSFKSGNATYDEKNSFCVDPTDFNPSATYKVESLQTYLNANPVEATKYEEAAWLIESVHVRQTKSGDRSGCSLASLVQKLHFCFRFKQ